MISKCSNNECRKPFLYLNNGRVIRTIKHGNNTTKIQHFWLCGDCHAIYDFRVSDDDVVSYMLRKVPLILSNQHYVRGEARALKALAG